MVDEEKTMDSETEEIRDILIAISVVAKRLATKLEDKKQQMQEAQYGKNERTCNGA